MGLYVSDDLERAKQRNTGESWVAAQVVFKSLEGTKIEASSKAVEKIQYSMLQFLLKKEYSEVRDRGIFLLEYFDVKGKGNIHYLISYVSYCSLSYEQAIKHSKEAILCFRQSNDMEGLAKAHTTLAAAYRKTDRYCKAIQHLELALGIKKKSNSFSPIAIALSLKHLGDYYCFLEEYEKALDYLRQAEDIHKETPNYFRYAATLSRLGFVYRKLSCFDLSWEYSMKAYRISYKKNYRNILFRSYINMGHLYDGMGQYRKSIKFVNKAQTLIGKTTLGKESSAGIFVLLSKSYLKINEEEKALEMALRGLQLNYNNQEERKILLYENIVECYYRQGDFQNCFIYQKLKEQSILEFQESRIIFEHNKSKYKQEETLGKREQWFHAKQEKEKEDLRQKIEESHKYLDDFVNILIHDVKAPIRHIQGFSKLLTKKINGNNKYSEYLDIINGSSVELSEMMDGLYAYAMVGVGSAPMDFVRIDAIKYDIEIMLRKVALQNHVRIAFDVEHQIYSQKGLLIPLFQYLIQNALKYAEHNVLLDIRISSEATQDAIILSCSDNGVGLNESDQEIIFLPFSKTSHADKQKKGLGMGIELATCLKIMKKHNGRILVESEKDKGTTFKMHFPIPK